MEFYSPSRTRTSDLVVTLDPELLPEVDYLISHALGVSGGGCIVSALSLRFCKA